MRLYDILQPFNVINESFSRAIQEFAKLDDTENVKKVINTYRQLLNRNEITEKNYKDINYWIIQGYDSFHKYVTAMDRYVKDRENHREEQRKELENSLKGESVHILSNDSCDVYIPLTHSESRRLGHGSTWCTSASSTSMWNQYVGSNKNIMIIVVSKTNSADNYAIRYTRQGEVLETRDLLQKMTHLAAAKQMENQHGVSTHSIWQAAEQHLKKVCSVIDNPRIKKEKQYRSFNDLSTSISGNSVSDLTLTHTVMTLIQESGRGPNEHFDINENTIITTGFLEYLNKHPLKSRIAKQIDKYWKYNVLFYIDSLDDIFESKINPITSEASELIRNSGSKVLLNLLSLQSKTPSNKVESYLLNIENKHRQKALVRNYCVLHAGSEYVLSDNLLEILIPRDITALITCNGGVELIDVANSSSRVYPIIDNAWVRSYIEEVRNSAGSPDYDFHNLSSYWTARDKLGVSEWPEFEKAILDNKDAYGAYYYCVEIIDRPWPEAEPYIMKDPYSAYAYARDLLKRRWPEAEPYIMKEKWSWAEYKKHFGIE